jgi:GTP diphosphokinase / guanosine-3',5'-bis(diphosphate) 3'-diphosphatase
MTRLPENEAELFAFLGKQPAADPISEDKRQSIWRAYDYAREQHAGQTRESGQPYVTHPLEVAKIIGEYVSDTDVIIAALLHDVIEDTSASLDDITANFGQSVASLVESVTKLSKYESLGLSKPQKDAENLRKLFHAMITDPRVTLIKLADRLHNIRTIDDLPPERQAKVARETLDIFAPLAELFGIWQIKRELEDASFKYADPENYNKISAAINRGIKDRKKALDAILQETRELIKKTGYPEDEIEISGRPKHLYSIYKKLQTAKYAGHGVERVYDKLGVRVVVSTKEQCYGLLGEIHGRWKALPGEFDDFISMRLPSGYQSLHTAVKFGPGEHDVVEFQIRTREMHYDAEYGIAAHWRYKYVKDGFGKITPSFEAKLAWLRGLNDSLRDVTDAREFVESLKSDVLEEQVYVFTPKGKIIDLPVGSTPVDFAYRIHTQVGHSCVGAKVNNRMVPLDYALQSGESVQIMTLKNARGPSRDWLNFVKTSGARTHIRRYFKRLQREENEAAGRDLLEKELKRLGLNVPFEEIAQICNAKTIEDLFAQIGSGDTTARTVAQKVLAQRTKIAEEDELSALPQLTPTERPSIPQGIQVRGMDGLLTRLAKCCNPVAGEPIVGYVTRGKGVTIHRVDCRTVLNERDRARLVDVTWGAEHQTYGSPVPVRIEAWDRVGLWRDISGAVADAGINITEVQQVPTRKPGRAVLMATLQIQSAAQLAGIIDKLNRLPDVIEARREQGGVAVTV